MAAMVASFEAALQEQNFAQRCHVLAQLGKDLRELKLDPRGLEELVDSLLPPSRVGAPGGTTTTATTTTATATAATAGDDLGLEAFSQKARLIVAKAAGCVGYGRKLLDHPSQSVRYSAVHEGLLRASDAREAFLSAASSRKLKKFLAKCEALPSDAEVLEHGWQLFGEKDKEVFWLLLARVSVEEQLSAFLADGKDMEEWLSNNTEERTPGLPQLARRFPNLMVKLVTSGTLHWRWYWVKEILEQDPLPVLRATIVEKHAEGSGPKRGYDPTGGNQDFHATLSIWGWRRHPELMLDMCRELTAREADNTTAGSFRNKGAGKGGRSQGIPEVQKLAEHLMAATSTRHALTLNKKLELLMRLWSVLPDSHKTPQVALVFAALLPTLASKEKEHRTQEIENLVSAFWRILVEVGRSGRQELLVGLEKQPTGCTEFLKTLARKVPPPLAVTQFFKVLEEFEAGTQAYQFILSDICKSSNGRHDALMQRVFAKYLRKEDEGPVKAAAMFQVLLKDARSMDVIQASFDLLVEHLDGHSELGLLRAVVQRMGALELESAQTQNETKHTAPQATLPMPTHWLRLVELPKTAPPHMDFLLHVLHTGTEPTVLLGAMIAKYGPRFFWDSLGHVLSCPTDKLLKQATPAPALEVLKEIDLAVVSGVLERSATPAALASSTSAPGGAATSRGIGARIKSLADGSVWGTVVADEGSSWKLDSGRIAKKQTEGDKWSWAASGGKSAGRCQYFATVAEVKKKVNVKDPAARNLGYTELLVLANKEKEQLKAFDDLLPYLLTRFSAEQEVGRSHLLGELLSMKLLPEKLWEDCLEHLRAFWKLCSKTRESANYASTWKEAGRLLVGSALKVWGGPTGETCGPSEACLFGLEVAQGLNLPELLVGCYKELKTSKALASALQWVLQTSVPLSSETGTPVEDFWAVLRSLAGVQFQREDEENTVRLWKVVDPLWVKVYGEMSSATPALGVKDEGAVVRGLLKGSWIRLEDELGFMLFTSEKTGKPSLVQVSDSGAEKGLWQTYLFVGEWWSALLAQGVKQRGMDFLFIGVVELLARRQEFFDHSKKEARWWEPLQCGEYRAAIAAIFNQVESGEIPAKEGSSMLARRIAALKDMEIMSCTDWKVRATKRRERVEDKAEMASAKGQPLSDLSFKVFPPSTWLSEQLWDIPKHHKYTPLPWRSFRCRDSIAERELSSLSQLLATGLTSQRQVLWQVVGVAGLLSGPSISALLHEAIAGLDPKFEGMARSIGRHYPYLNSALTKDEQLNGSSDVLTPLVELLLLDDSSRDAHVGRLMERPSGDCEYFLFFGSSFARHLSGVRQEWLQRCLSRLRAPPTTGEGPHAEFYHYKRRGPGLCQLACYGSAEPGWRKVLSQAGSAPADKAAQSGAVQMYLWHPQTQTEFLKKALVDTDSESLALIPRLEYANGVARVSELLGSYPKEQSAKETEGDLWGWEVIQAAGAYSDVKTEVERRFQELSSPWTCDVVDDREVETLLTALGRADDATASMKVLGQYAGKVKQAKEAVTKMISQLSPPQARVLIRDIMLPKKAGVGLQVAGLKTIVDLRIPEPLELYCMAWRKGKCQRDVAGNILSKVATSADFAAEEVRHFFEFFDQADQQEDQAYVAGLLLDQLIESSEWSLPFLPQVIAKLALLPGATEKAMKALQQCKSNVTEVVAALTEVLKGARLALRSEPKGSKECSDGKLLSDLSGLMAFSSINSLASHVARMQLMECEPEVLQAHVLELLRRWQDAVQAEDALSKSLLDSALSLWVKLLRPGQAPGTWATVVQQMEARLQASKLSAQNLGAMAQALTLHVPSLGLASCSEEWNQILKVLRSCFLRLLGGPLAVYESALQKANTSCPADASFVKENEARRKVKEELLLKHWVGLLAHGCLEVESQQLFASCPEKCRLQLATALVEAAVRSVQDTQAVEEKNRASRSAQQERPEDGWHHSDGVPVAQIKAGNQASGVVTNSSQACGVFVNFGCEKDGKLGVPVADWKKFRVGDRVERMIVNSVNVAKKFVELLLVGAAGSVGAAAASKEVARRALRWLASPAELRDVHLSTLTKLWAMVIALESTGEAFDSSLELLGAPLPPVRDLVQLVEQVLGHAPQKPLARTALQWLVKQSPVEAVRLWPALLTPNKGSEKVELVDVRQLLELCAAHGLEFPPKLSQLVVRGLSDEVVAALCGSELPEARLAAIQALRERHGGSGSLEPPKELRALCVDNCTVVRSAARDVWLTLGGKQELWQQKKPEDAEEENEEEDA